MNMLLDVLKVSSSPEVTGTGHWVTTQNSITGAINRTWVSDDGTESTQNGVIKDIPCMARGILTAGIRGSADSQNFDSIYTNVEWIKVNVSSTANITKRDRITRIRDKNGHVVWKEEELDGSPATVFNVMGITPVPNPFGTVVEMQILLKRAAVQE